MRRLLDRYWPGGVESGLSPEDVLQGKQSSHQFQRMHWDRLGFQFQGTSEKSSYPPVSDIIVFSAEVDEANNTFFTPRPLFTSATQESHHHEDQLHAHALSKETIRRVLYGA